MRLVEGSSEIEGRVEVCFSQRWGTVGSDGWTQTNTKIVCNDLGYEMATGNQSQIMTVNNYFVLKIL